MAASARIGQLLRSTRIRGRMRCGIQMIAVSNSCLRHFPCGRRMCLLTLAAERGGCLLTMIVMAFYGRLIDNRPGWHTLWRGKVTRPPWNGPIYEYNR